MTSGNLDGRPEILSVTGVGLQASGVRHWGSAVERKKCRKIRRMQRWQRRMRQDGLGLGFS